ncbi:MAG TPA: radical SAM protein [Dehalococcoidales bacterium]|nr:radical SAM protein [Dehalococcoidales bacterium]
MTEEATCVKQPELLTPRLHLVAWEITRSCNLLCAHCRGSATPDSYHDELTTGECFRLVDQILEVGRPIIILTGGEPLRRPDVLEIARYAAGKGLRVVMGTNGTLITGEIAAQLKTVPVSRLGISLDFPAAGLQDNFRGQAGAFDAAMKGIANARRAGIEVQINSTISRLNVDYLDELLALALEVGAVAFHPFMLVPTGRGKGLESAELSPERYERTLHWIYDKQVELGDRLFFKPTDVPHYMRVMKQRQKQDGQVEGKSATGHNPANAMTRGCLAGIGFCFVSYRGKVKGCGYLDVEAGDIRQASFARVWADSPLFRRLRDLTNLKGKCGNCEYKRICGGCRARAYEATGDCLEAEPYCVYQPAARPALSTKRED